MFRKIMGAVALAAVLVGASACAAGPTQPASADAGQAAAGSTRTITGTMLGDVANVPVEPQRVVALWRTGSELAELGVVPVGQLEGELDATELSPELFASVQHVPEVGTYEGVDLEKLIELQPDLIVGMDNGNLSIDYSELQQIAPTVIFEIAEPTDVWRAYPLVADAVGRAGDFDARNAELEARLAEVKAANGAGVANARVTHLSTQGDSVWISTSKSLMCERLTAAGYTYNPAYLDNPDRYVAQLTHENLATLADQDIIFYSVNIDGTPSPDTAALLAMPAFAELPAVKAGRAYPIVSGTIYTFHAASLQAETMADVAAGFTR